VDRVCGSDVFDALVLRAKPGYRHFFYGASQEVLNRLEAQLRQRAPQAVIAGRYSPPFRQLSAAERRRDTAMINAAKPDIVWVGLGAPKQELWIAETRRLLDAPLVVGVGAVFDFVAGTKRRAPHVLQVIGLEWLHRLMSEPRRLASRYLTTNATFVLGVSKSLICRRGSGK
jgi:N-acetylglucosaminyldiphosphoundecaprenol N-acetyl-beta-D-mannosaminyltransferase